jgi:hypothetical protein
MNLAVKVVRQRISQPATSPATPLDSQRSSENLDPRRHPDAKTTRTGGQDLPRRNQAPAARPKSPDPRRDERDERGRRE